MLLVTYIRWKRSESNGKSKIHYNSFDQASLVTGASKIDARFLLAISDALETIRRLFEERIKCHCVSYIYIYIYKPHASRSLPNARSYRVTRRKIVNNCGRERILSVLKKKKKLSIDEKSCE